MIKHNQDGAISGLTISLVLAIVLLLAVAIFAGWAFSSRQDYKNNADVKIHAAVVATQGQDAIAQKAAIAAAIKYPYDTFNGPEQYGSISFQYPKTWSAYVSGIGVNATGMIDGFFAPGILTASTDGTEDFALRVQILGQAYNQVAQGYVAQAAGTNAQVTAAAYTLPRVPDVVGLEVVGAIPGIIPQGDTATMIILPERTNTIEIWSDGTANLSDFNNVVLKTFTFSP
jgi:hypothetical protein